MRHNRVYTTKNYYVESFVCIKVCIFDASI